MSDDRHDKNTEVTKVEPEDVDLATEPKTEWSFVVAHYALIALLAGVLWRYRDAEPKNLAAALTAIVVALIAVRFDRIKKLTSKLVSYETRPAVEQANKATRRANKAANEAREKAERAEGAALKTEAGLEDVRQTLAMLRAVTADLSGISLDTVARQGRFGSGLSARRRCALADTHEKTLREIGCDEEQVQSATRLLRASVLFDKGIAATNAGVKVFGKRGITAEQNETFNAEMKALRERNLFEFEIAPPDEIRAFLAKHDLLGDANVARAFDDYEKFWATRELPADVNDDDG